jgi:hypothetical protein
MRDEFEFRVDGKPGLMKLDEIEQALRDRFADEINTADQRLRDQFKYEMDYIRNRIEKRMCEVVDVRPVYKGQPGVSLGKMPLKDVLIKFK